MRERDATECEIQLALLPGLDGTGILFEPLLDVLPERFQPVVCCYPNDNMMCLNSLAEGIESELAHLSDLVFVAESFGSLVAINLLRRRQVRPRAVVFVVGFGNSPCPVLLRLVQLIPAHLVPWQRFPLMALKWFVFGDTGGQSERSLFNRAGASVNPEVLMHRLKLIASTPFVNLDANWSLPVADVRADSDRLVRARCASWFRQRFSDIQTVSFPGGHYLLQMHAPAFAEWLEYYLDTRVFALAPSPADGEIV